PDSARAEEDGPPPPPRRKRFRPLARARGLAKAGRHSDAADLGMRRAERERSQRGRFLRRMEAASILVEAGQPMVALAIREEVSETITEDNLETWEGAGIVARALGRLYRANVDIDRDTSSVQHLFVRVCRLDPIQGMQIGRGSPEQ